MKRKTLNILFWIFALLPFLIAVVLLFVLPDTVPIHWTQINQGPDRYGSKYEILIIPAVYFVISFGLKAAMRFVEKVRRADDKRGSQIAAQYAPPVTAFVLFGVTLWLFGLIVSAA